MNRTTWQQWYGTNVDAYRELAAQCDRVFVAGLSMGGTLTLRLAQEHPDISGIVLVNAAIKTDDPRAKFAKLLQYVLPSLPGIGNDIKKPGMNEYCYDRLPVRAFVQLQNLWDVVARDMQRVTQPALIFSSLEDHAVEPSNSTLIHERIASADKSLVQLYESFHVATLDYDADTIFQQSLQFFDRVR